MVLYKINKIKQLIDINGDATNFDATFTAISKDGTEFDVLVIDQTTLDNTEELEYKKAEGGKMGGRIVADKNVYQNHFLILKSDKPCDVEVEITKQEIQPKVISPEKLDKMDMQNMQNMAGGVGLEHEMIQETTAKSGSVSKHWKLILVLIVIIVAGYFFLSSKSGNTSNITENITNNLPVPNLSLLSRLNNLQIS